MILNGTNILLVVIICATSIENALGWRTFWKGRRRDGNLHIDSAHQIALQKGYSLPPDQWFDQKLDHFDQSNNKLWKQVNFYFPFQINSHNYFLMKVLLVIVFFFSALFCQ